MDKDKKFLLVVDDSRGIQKQLRWAFPGFEVATAGDREDAMAQFRRVQPAGRAAMDGADWARGTRPADGEGFDQGGPGDG